MSDEITNESYSSATERVVKAHRDAVAKVKAEITKSQAEALKKLSH